MTEVAIIIHQNDLDKLFEQSGVVREEAEWCAVPAKLDFIWNHEAGPDIEGLVELHFYGKDMHNCARSKILVPHIIVLSGDNIDTIGAYMPGSKDWPSIQRCMCDAHRNPLATLAWEGEIHTSTSTQDVDDVIGVGEVMQEAIEHWIKQTDIMRRKVAMAALEVDFRNNADRDRLLEYAETPFKEELEQMTTAELEQEAKALRGNSRKKASKTNG